MQRLFVILVASLAAVMISGSAASAEANWNATSDAIWDVTTRDESSQHTALRRALVWDMAEFDGRMYVAGKFRDVRSPDGTLSPSRSLPPSTW